MNEVYSLTYLQWSLITVSP